MQSRIPKPGGAIHYALARICEESRKACLSLPPFVSALCYQYDALFPHQHSPRPKSAFHALHPPPNPASAGNLVMARVGSKYPAHSESRASPLRVLPPWVCYHLGILDNGLRCVRSGSCCIQDPLGCSAAPGLLLAWNFTGIHLHQASIASSRGGPKELIDIPPCLRSAGTSIGDVGRIALLCRRQDKDTHVVTLDRFAPGSDITHPASPPYQRTKPILQEDL